MDYMNRRKAKKGTVVNLGELCRESFQHPEPEFLCGLYQSAQGVKGPISRIAMASFCEDIPVSVIRDALSCEGFRENEFVVYDADSLNAYASRAVLPKNGDWGTYIVMDDNMVLQKWCGEFRATDLLDQCVSNAPYNIFFYTYSGKVLKIN